jgi:hypothetical protein
LFPFNSTCLAACEELQKTPFPPFVKRTPSTTVVNRFIKTVVAELAARSTRALVKGGNGAAASLGKIDSNETKVPLKSRSANLRVGAGLVRGMRPPRRASSNESADKDILSRTGVDIVTEAGRAGTIPASVTPQVSTLGLMEHTLLAQLPPDVLEYLETPI